MFFEHALWVLLAFFVILYGNGEYDLITVVLTDTRIWRIEGIQKSKVDKATMKWAEPAGAATLTAAIISFIIALWPIFGFMSLVMTVILCIGGVMCLAFLPTVGFLKMKTPEGYKEEGLSEKKND
eukprot:gene27161-2400_t